MTANTMRAFQSRSRKPRQSNHRRNFRLLWPFAGLLILSALPGLLILPFRWVPVPTSAFMLAELMAGRKPVHDWVSWAEIAPAAAIAVVAAEDQNFPKHWGFDFDAINQAVEQWNTRGTLRGASTISQQTAKNLFLWQGRSWLRKGLEAGLTMAIELCWPKQRILEVYLNIAQFGPDIYGISAASRTYFQVPPSRLTPRQAALLAAVLPSPSRNHLSPPSPYILQRADHIQRQVKQLGGPAYLIGFDSMVRSAY